MSAMISRLKPLQLLSWRKHSYCICASALITLCEKSLRSYDIINSKSMCQPYFQMNTMLTTRALAPPSRRTNAIVCVCLTVRDSGFVTGMSLACFPQDHTPGNILMNKFNDHCLFFSEQLLLMFPWARQLTGNCFTEVALGPAVEDCSSHMWMC